MQKPMTSAKTILSLGFKNILKISKSGIGNETFTKTTMFHNVSSLWMILSLVSLLNQDLYFFEFKIKWVSVIRSIFLAHQMVTFDNNLIRASNILTIQKSTNSGHLIASASKFQGGSEFPSLNVPFSKI